ncbi:hypothetical protein RIF29_24080 [Crotalaria pallida]|uniref:RING-type E3 ubiquitin transferase n=1 Tax=Crotalaria pallida TaxID=3830 RepID=A0AAN9EJV3_CROPI
MPPNVRCSTCKTMALNDCRVCKLERESLALEKKASKSSKLPCKYMSVGCPMTIPFYLKWDHETYICDFRPYKCPYAMSCCSAHGDIPFLVAHLRDAHMVDMYSASSFNRHYVESSDPLEVIKATSLMLSVFHCFGQYFFLHFESFYLGGEPVYFAFLRFMGNHSEASNYSYSLEVGPKGHTQTFEGIPQSIRDWHMEARDTFDGLIIYRKDALSYSDKDNKKELKLRITGKIWENQQNNSNDDDDEDGLFESSMGTNVGCVDISS